MRYFKANTHLVLPRSLQTGAGDLHVRLAPGDTIALDDKACFAESRFVSGRMRAGDLVETEAPPTDTAEPAAKAAKGK